MLTILLLAAAARAAPTPTGPAPAAQGAAVTSPDGLARFSVLADGLLRMEFASDGEFDDRQTLAVVNRHLPVPPFTHATSGRTLTVKTARVQLTYTSTPPPPPPPPPPVDMCGSALPGHDAALPKVRSAAAPDGLPHTTQAQCCAACAAAADCSTWVRAGGSAPAGICYLLASSGPAVPAANRTTGGKACTPGRPAGFTPGSLRVESVAGTVGFSWAFGDMDGGNLLGTSRSLDGITGSIDLNCSNTNTSQVPAYCALGPLSRAGWAVIGEAPMVTGDPS